MSDITEHLCSIRLDQLTLSEKCELLPPSSFESWLNKAETHIKRLKDQHKTCSPDEIEKLTDEHECIVSVMDDIYKFRADVIWDLAKDGAGNTDLMTQREADIYTELAGLAADLRGEDT